MSAEGGNDLPNLPADTWGAIARAALRLEADDVRAWARLSLVSSAWRVGLQGALCQYLAVC